MGWGFLFVFCLFVCLFFNLQSEKNGAVKKRRSNQADIPDSLCQEAETCYRLRLPEDFYQFWKFCEELDPEKPSGEVLNFASSNFHSQKQPEGRQTGGGQMHFNEASVFQLKWRIFT